MTSAQHDIPNPPTDTISSLQFSPSTTYIAVASWDRTVSIYKRAESDSDTPFAFSHRIQCRAPVLDLCWGADDSSLYCVGLDYDVRSLPNPNDPNGDDSQRVLSTHEAASNKIAYSREEDLLLSTSWDGTLHIHIHPSSQQDMRFTRLRLSAKPFALSLSVDKAVLAMAERKVSVYDLRALGMLVEQTGGTSDREDIQEGIQPWQQRESSLKFMTRALACMPDNTGFTIGSIEGRCGVEWFDPERQKDTYAFKCHRHVHESIADPADPDLGLTESELAEAKANPSKAYLEDLELVYPLNALAFHPLHGTFATGGGDGLVYVWDREAKKRVKVYDFGKEVESVACVDFSGDGRFMGVGLSPPLGAQDEGEEVEVERIRVVVRVLAEGELKGKGKVAKKKSGEGEA
ncbi:hypothetical protein BAUCODRAFT_39139 [Baudoinia panamericana UAMH 10762]|uniref:Uncharacterized protein n=1 Tax=Baudoinia panamericana (strain UAMH 10762) TaxID=717646 RepID=M2MZ83_BAUPA|nr:uncharacterized protein BAUCODRAFT_39139 [Baudoinia panamericana UAMH 10762]EMC91984.1 hypothetical protein BAUCODRAFT_39139 [Baudoinia panamericana UAMH 10762]